MSILSAAMGRVIGLVPKQWTQYAVSRVDILVVYQWRGEGSVEIGGIEGE